MSNEKKDINLLITKQKDIEKIINGEKTAVRRNDRYADKGDTLELDGHQFIVENVYHQKLGQVTEENARQEGYRNLDEYIQALTSIHHGSVWDPNLEVWAHELTKKN
ncbi:ASCH domain-containing protein [Virgibacillus oceani]|uniref:ASCH domain-containing protein n=1 Tax=Virgibacillus oceani TaxID=1479511 RepID=A0A917H656_9BACI|nr:ASCH domain-containing protein [Virgibacillus oceani]GGG68406.1 hypothetical protein GCM10011398_10320 [Virgibacillus oceani]